MRVLHCASRAVLTAVLALAPAGCSKDSNAPHPFDPEGATADVSAMQDAFAAPAVQSFAAAGSTISATFGGGAVAASARVLSSPAGAGAGHQAAALARLLHPRRSADALSASAGSIPPSALGKTYVFDAQAQEYVVSDRTGAPSNGVRFIIYAVSPVTGKPAEPLNELGYADVIDESTGSTISWRVTLLSGGTTYLDYHLTGVPAQQGGVITIAGFVSNGTARADFTLKNTIVETPDLLRLTLDYDLAVPSRDLSFDYVAVFTAPQQGEITLSLDLTMTGRNGTVTLAGTGTESSSAYTVQVNGELFATITQDAAGTISFTGHDGAALTPAEEQTLRKILDWYETSGDFLGSLLDPIA